MGWLPSSGGYSGWFKNQNRGTVNQFSAMADQAFGPQAEQRIVSGYNADLARILGNQGAGAYGNLAARGFNPTSPDLYGQTRATNLAGFRAKTRGDLQGGYLDALRQKFGMLQGMAQQEYRAPSGGVLGALSGAVGMASGLGWQPLK